MCFLELHLNSVAIFQSNFAIHTFKYLVVRFKLVRGPKRYYEFFHILFSLSNRETSFKSQFPFSIKIEK